MLLDLGGRIAVSEHLEGKGGHREQQQHIQETTESPTADNKQQPEGQYPEKDDPEHFENTCSPLNGFSLLGRAQTGSRLSRLSILLQS
jgi:hypothetical protein